MAVHADRIRTLRILANGQSERCDEPWVTQIRCFAKVIFSPLQQPLRPEYKPNATRIRLMSTPESGQDLRGYAASKRRAAPSFGETVLVVV